MFLNKKTFKTLNKVTIKKSAILHNIAYIQSINPDYEVFPTIKSNAYGHGIKEIGSILNEIPLRYVCVDSYFEACKFREVSNHPVLIIGYTHPDNYQIMKNYGFAFFVYDKITIQALWKTGRKIKIHLKIDTGMSRQWVQLHEIEDIVTECKKYKNLEIEWIASHLADADNTENDFSFHQIKIFQDALQILESMGITPKYKHISSTAGSLKFHQSDFNAIRPGIGIYWVNPLSPQDPDFSKGEPLELALTLMSTIILKKQIKAGEKVSYNGTFEAPKDMTIGIIPMGYYEALPRKLSSNYSLSFKGKDVPILGRICMNLCIIDISETDAQVNDTVEVINTNKKGHQTIYHIAEKSETIPYENLIRISETIRREVI